MLIRLNAFVLLSSWELIVKSSMPGFEKRFFFQSVINVHKLYRPQKHFLTKSKFYHMREMKEKQAISVTI